MKNVFIFVILLHLLSVAHAEPFADQQKESQARDIFIEIMSPFCPGRSLNDCPSSKAHELKDEIRSELESGKDRQTILEGVFSKIGDEYRAVPKQSGFGLTTWLVPLGFVALGALLIGWYVRQQKHQQKHRGKFSTSDIIVDERVERELRENVE